MDRASRSRLLWILLAVGLLGVLGALPPRLATEAHARSVDVALDYDAFTELFHSQGLSESDGFKQMKDKGATAIAFTENYLERLQSGGKLRWYSGVDFPQVRRSEGLTSDAKIDSNRMYLSIYDDAVFSDLVSWLPVFLGSDKVREWARAPTGQTASRDHPRVLEVVGTERSLTGAGLGFSPSLIEHYRAMGFRIVLRPENRAGENDATVTRTLELLPHPDVLIFSGLRNEALGYPDPILMYRVANAMRRNHWELGSVEVPIVKAEVKGQEFLLRQIWDPHPPKVTDPTRFASLPPPVKADGGVMAAVRVQSINPGQLAKMEIDDAVDMFRLGVRERTVRMVYLRPFADPQGTDASALETNLRYVESVAGSPSPEQPGGMLVQSHLAAGAASELKEIRVPLWSSLLLNLATGAAMSLLVLAFWPDAPLVLLLLIPALGTLGALGAGLTGRAETWAKLAALLAALTMPTLGITVIFRQMQAAPPGKSRPAAILQSIVWLAWASGISIVGACMVASLLAYTPFMLEADQFRGIKLLMVIPPLLVLLYVLRADGKKLGEVFGSALSTPMTVGHALALAVIAGGAVFYIMRTGNLPESGASDTERLVRNLLQNVFVARPRFKDFMIGHPATILAGMAALMGARTRTCTLLLFALAAIGQADVVDTFAHIHTPFLVSLLRFFHGLWLGALVGTAIAWFWPRPARREGLVAPPQEADAGPIPIGA